MNYNNTITVILNTKGGVGKSTTALQVIVPFLYSKINQNPKEIVPTHKKIKLYDVDFKNNSAKNLEKSELFDSKLIKTIDLKLENTLTKELNEIDKEQPVVFDIGNTYTAQFLDILENIYTTKTINFLIPLKQDEDDLKNTIDTITMIRKKYDNANISLVLSDAISEPLDMDDLKTEFELVFGNYYNNNNGKIEKSLFEKTDLNQDKFFTVKKAMSAGSALLVRTKIWTARTIYENSFVAKRMKNDPMSVKEIQDFNDLMKRIAQAKKEKKKDIQSLEEKKRIINEKMNIYKQCSKYEQNYLQPAFNAIMEKQLIIE